MRKLFQRAINYFKSSRLKRRHFLLILFISVSIVTLAALGIFGYRYYTATTKPSENHDPAQVTPSPPPPPADNPTVPDDGKGTIEVFPLPPEGSGEEGPVLPGTG